MAATTNGQEVSAWRDARSSEAQALPDNRAVGCALLVIDTFDVPLSLKELYDLSDVVVEGVVAATFPSREIGRGLETDALIDVTSVWKGSNTIRQVLISQAGGTRGRFCIAPTQYALVRPGEKCILFLREDDRRNLRSQHRRCAIM